MVVVVAVAVFFFFFFFCGCLLFFALFYCFFTVFPGTTSLSHPLGNVYMFYKQFVGAVDKSLQGLEAPVEKEFNVREQVFV